MFLQIIYSLDEITDETKEILSSFKWKLKDYKDKVDISNYIPNILRWDFGIWEIDSPQTYFTLIEYIFNDYKLLETFKITDQQFREFLHDVYSGYNDISYHNFRHAFDVIHSSYLFLKDCLLDKVFPTLDIFALLLAALIHDVGHNGLSNLYHVESVSPLAILYNDRSVLENHHCSLGFQLMLRHGILDGLTREQFKRFRRIVIDSVLYTDLSKHFELIDKLKVIATQHDLTREEARKLLIVAILKCSDVSNPIKPFEISKKWSEAIQAEKYCQGDLLNKIGYPIPRDIDRSLGIGSIAESQIRFIDNIVDPLFKMISFCIPQFAKFNEIIKENREQWYELLIEERGGEST